MVHWNFNGTAGEDIRQNRDKGTAFMAVQHRIDNMTAIGAQHTTVVTHRFAGGALNKPVNHLRSGFTKPAVLAVLAYSPYHVVTFIGFCHQTGDFLWRILEIGIEGNN